jgi:hypothetical protein
LSVDGMIVAASTTLLSESRSGQRSGALPWVLLAIGSVASLAANVAVAEPTAIGRVIAAWPSFALIGSYEFSPGVVSLSYDVAPRAWRKRFATCLSPLWRSLSSLLRSPAREDAQHVQQPGRLRRVFDHDSTCANRRNVTFAKIAPQENRLLMRQVRRAAAGHAQRTARPSAAPCWQETPARSAPSAAPAPRSPSREREPEVQSAVQLGRASAPAAGHDVRRQASQWVVAIEAADGSLSSGQAAADRYGRHERWARLVKAAGNAGQFADARPS